MTFPKDIPIEALQLDRWPTVDTSRFDRDRASDFATMALALNSYVRGESPANILKNTGVTRWRLNRALRRCICVHEDGRLWGYRALIRGARARYQRSLECIASTVEDSAGFSGAFAQLLRQHPKAERLIALAIRPGALADARSAAINLTPLHKQVLEQLRKDGVLGTEYPFNSASCGYRSLARYVKRLRDAGHRGLVRGTFGQAALDGLIAGTGRKHWLVPRRPLQITCYDEQLLPFFGTIELTIDGKTTYVPLSRCSLCLWVDEDSEAILAYHISLRRRVCAGDFIAVMEHYFTPWKPMQLTIPGLAYPPGAGFPSGVVENCLRARVGLIKVDNDLTHYADSVLGYMINRTGLAIQFGAVRRWITRIAVERVFAELQKRHFRRLPSTSGSGPKDPAVDDPVGKSVRASVKVSELAQLMDVILAQHNALPRPRLLHKSALEHLTTAFAQNGPCSVIPPFAMEPGQTAQFPTDVMLKTVRGNQRKGVRPYVELDRAHYTSDLLCQSWSMIGQKLSIHVSGDYRTVRAYRQNGEEYSRLAVLGHWSFSAHSREVRLAVNGLRAQGEIIVGAGQDPMDVYLDYTADKVKNNFKPKRPSPSKDAAELARALRTQGLVDYVAPPKPPAVLAPPTNDGSASRWRAALLGEEGDTHDQA